MNRISIHADRAYSIGKVDDRVFSSFVEHMGRTVYEGIYEPDHPTANAQGFRQDVLDMVQPLNIPLVRYPGGNFISGFDWKDTIGPKASRPRKLDLAWRTTESNQFGMDEFVDWCEQAGTQMMGAVNLGTGTPKDAGEIVEYCNHAGETYWSDLRAQNGHPRPHGVKVWCVGNEMSGPWQICHMSAEDYAKKARETAKMMKWVDPSIELVACGSAGNELSSYPSWDRIVLEETYEHVDFISLHKYYRVGLLDSPNLLACFVDLDRFFHQMEAVCDYVKALKRSSKTMMLSFDEWNIAGVHYAKSAKNWECAPHIGEMWYTVRDAVAFAGMGMTILNHADRVKMACQAQLVNVLGPIMTQKGGMAIRQTIYYPYLLLSQYGRGEAIRTIVDVPTHKTCFGDTPQVYTSLVWKEAQKKLTLFAINIDEEHEAQANVSLEGFGDLKLQEHIIYTGEKNAANTFETGECVLPQQAAVDLAVAPVLPPLSFNVLVYKG